MLVFFIKTSTVFAVTLGESVDLAIQSNPIVNILQSDVNTSAARLKQARSSFYPRMTLTIENGASEVSGGKWQSLTRSRVQIQQLLYDFRKTSFQVNSAEQLHKNKELQLLAGRQRLALLVSRAYLELLKLDTILLLVDQNIEAYEEFLAIMRKREVAGVSTFSDVQRVKGLLQGAKKDQITYLSDKKFAEQAFTLIVGQAPVNRVVPDLDKLLLPWGEAELLGQVKNHYYGVKAKVYEVDSARSLLRSSRRALYPEVSLQASISNEQSIGTDNEWEAENQLKVVVSYDLLDGFLARNKVNERQSLFMRSQYQLDDYLRTLEKEVREAFSTWQRMAQEKTANSELLAVNREIVVLYRQEFELGQKSLLDVTTVQRDYYQAAVDGTYYHFEYYISLLGVLFYLNKVTDQVRQL
nr:TolC family protein [Endozoicomonas sp.]